MQTIIRKKGAFDDLHFKVDLTNYDKTGTDVEDIMFSVKINENNNDTDLLYKTLLATEISFTDTDGILDVLVQWGFDEYAPFKVGVQYKAGLFVKFIGDPVADEHVDTTFLVNITQDFLRS